MKYRYSFPLFTVVVLILMCAVNTCSAQTTPTPPYDIIREANFFIPNPEFKEKINTKKGAYYVFERNYNRVLVNARTGKVENFVWSYPQKKEKTYVDQETAETRIRAWLKDRKIDLTGWNFFKNNTYGDNHLFSFGKKTPDGIMLNSHLEITMDSHGNFVSYIYMNNPITISLKPKYSKEKLIGIAFKEAKQKNEKLKSYRMRVVDRHGDIERQMLLAEIWIKGDATHPHVCGSGEQGFEINAHTGEIIASMGH
ncbi:MAG: hypothetical protein ACYC27_12935 [Armatimonadota bacterium]